MLIFPQKQSIVVVNMIISHQLAVLRGLGLRLLTNRRLSFRLSAFIRLFNSANHWICNEMQSNNKYTYKRCLFSSIKLLLTFIGGKRLHSAHRLPKVWARSRTTQCTSVHAVFRLRSRVTCLTQICSLCLI